VVKKPLYTFILKGIKPEEQYMEEVNKTCFVISPIGQPDSDIRKRSDQIFKHLLEPASDKCGYKAIRADHIREPGIITSQVIQHIIEDPIVIADLTGRNPNVFYELAIRHALRKPFVQIIQEGEEKPFDVAGIRTIEVNHHDLDSAQSAREQIIGQINSMKGEGYQVSSPISVTIDTDVLRRSGKPEQRQLADVLSAIDDMRSVLSSLDKRLNDQSKLSLDQKSLFNADESMEIVYKLRKINMMSMDQFLRLRDIMNSFDNSSNSNKIDKEEKSNRLLEMLKQTISLGIENTQESNLLCERLLNYYKSIR
jgi:hypothetical protein